MNTFSPGDTVRIISGPFIRLEGKVLEVNREESMVKIQIVVMGRPTPVELKFREVEKVSPA